MSRDGISTQIVKLPNNIKHISNHNMTCYIQRIQHEEESEADNNEAEKMDKNEAEKKKKVVEPAAVDKVNDSSLTEKNKV